MEKRPGELTTEELLEALPDYGVTARQLRRWHSLGLIPIPRTPGRGATLGGRIAYYPPDSVIKTLEFLNVQRELRAKRIRTLDVLTLFGWGYSPPEVETLRKAYHDYFDSLMNKDEWPNIGASREGRMLRRRTSAAFQNRSADDVLNFATVEFLRLSNSGDQTRRSSLAVESMCAIAGLTVEGTPMNTSAAFSGISMFDTLHLRSAVDNATLAQLEQARDSYNRQRQQMAKFMLCLPFRAFATTEETERWLEDFGANELLVGRRLAEETPKALLWEDMPPEVLCLLSTCDPSQEETAEA